MNYLLVRLLEKDNVKIFWQDLIPKRDISDPNDWKIVINGEPDLIGRILELTPYMLETLFDNVSAERIDKLERMTEVIFKLWFSESFEIMLGGQLLWSRRLDDDNHTKYYAGWLIDLISQEDREKLQEIFKGNLAFSKPAKDKA